MLWPPRRERKQWEAIRAEQHQRQQQWQAVQASELRQRLEQHQQQLEQKRQQRLQQGLPSASTSGGGSTLDQSRTVSAAGADAVATGLDAAAAAAAGRAAAAVTMQAGALPTAAEVAAHLDQLLKGKAVIKPAVVQQQLQPDLAPVGSGSSKNGSCRNSLHKSKGSSGWLKRVTGALKGGVRESSEHVAGSAADAGRLGAGGASLKRRKELSGRGEAPLMHIEARHAQAEKAAREMVEEALLQQGIEAYRYVEG